MPCAAGIELNLTEKRAVLHTALRAPRDARVIVDGENVVPKVHAVLDRMSDFSLRLRAANGWVTPAGTFAMSSMSESVAPTWDRLWPTRLSGTTPRET